MKLYKKYIFSEIFIACAASIALFVTLLLAGNAMRDIVDWLAAGRLSFFDTCKILWVLVPSVVSYALPLGMMTGILIVIGRMSSQNEILAMKSVGIGLHEISKPIFLLAVFATLFSLYINLYYAPDSISKYRQSFRKVVQDKPMRFIVPRTFNSYFSGYVVYVDTLEKGKFKDMKVWQFDQHDDLEMYISAESGDIVFEESSGLFTLSLNNGNAEKFNMTESELDAPKVPQVMFFKNISINLPVKEFVGEQAGGNKKYSHMTLNELLKEKRTFISKKNVWPYSEIRHKKTLINMQISNNVASAFGIMIMALIAIPLGLKTNRAETAFNVGLALCICFGYYFLMVVFSWFGDCTRARPDILIWIPNALLTLIGASLFKRSLRN